MAVTLTLLTAVFSIGIDMYVVVALIPTRLCGQVGCCDESPGRHARAHFESTGHRITRSLEPGERWAWRWIDEVAV